MSDQFYGNVRQAQSADELDRQLEELAIHGYTVLHGLFDDAALAQWRTRIDDVYSKQEENFGKKELAAIQELDVCRAPLLYDLRFASEMANHPAILRIVQRILGEWAILNLQNAIINRPGLVHHQSAWHRDLPHQNFVISHPIAINALIAIDPFSPETGGTQLLPHSHKSETLPSSAFIERHLLQTELPAGSAILFDAMVFHRAGKNTSNIIRRAVNHLYTAPILKQQYDFPRALSSTQVEPKLARLLGMDSQVPLDDTHWRRARAARLQGAKP